MKQIICKWCKCRALTKSEKVGIIDALDGAILRSVDAGQTRTANMLERLARAVTNGRLRLVEREDERKTAN